MEKKTRRRAAFAACALCVAFLGGCETRPAGGWDSESQYEPHASATYYTVVVHRGDTMSKIAARYDTTSDDLARANGISVNAPIHPGDVMHVPPTRGAREAVMRDATNSRAAYAPPTDRDRELASDDPALAPRRISTPDRVVVRREPNIVPNNIAPDIAPRPVRKPLPAIAAAPVTVHGGETLPSYSAGNREFSAPVSGKIIQGFGDTGSGQRNDGINIAAAAGTPIHAAADGTVSYAGNELKGYGNLILIKHDGDYVTAYAHANSIGVARGQHVSKGDVIGTVGQTGDVDQPQLHFEVRQGMRPVDPRPLMMASAS